MSDKRQPSYPPLLSIQPDIMPLNMEPSPTSIHGTMNFFAFPRNRPEQPDMLFQSAAQSTGPFNPDFAPYSSSAPAALPYSVNQQNHHDALFQRGRAQSQAAHYSLASPPMHRNTSHCSEPIMRSMQIPPFTSAGRRISNEMLVPPLAQVQEQPSPDVGMAPEAYFENLDPYYLSSTGTNLPLHEMYAARLSSTPSMTASSGAEQPYPMTRENSFAQPSPYVDMERLHSSTSYADPLFGAFPRLDEVNLFKKPEDLLAMGGIFPNSTKAQYSVSEYQTSLSPGCTPMERVDSTCSVKSTASSVERRAREARERVLLAQSTSIAPMPQPLPRVTHGKRTTQQVAKVKQKLKHAKLLCNKCNEIPEGFRGDHELRRHFSAKHGRVVKKFVCRDPTAEGLSTPLTALIPLSHCKACTSGKLYGAYYNAAAHLRRAHFKAKSPRGGRNSGAIGEKRGGKGGGDWPPMAVLRAWFQEIDVPRDGPASLVTGDDPPDEDSLSPASASTTHMNTNTDSFSDAYATPADGGFASNPMSASYEGQSPQDGAQLSLTSSLNGSDVDMFVSSQNSTASALMSMDNTEFDNIWLDLNLNTDLALSPL
ncbi:hypothetical protein V8C42DRAFT_96412 [Trichoderma barbatum]